MQTLEPGLDLTAWLTGNTSEQLANKIAPPESVPACAQRGCGIGFGCVMSEGKSLLMDVSEIPMAPGALPVLGHGHRVIAEPIAFIKSLAEQGTLARFRIGNRTIIMACEPILAHQVLADQRTFEIGGLFFDRLREITGNGLITCPSEDHLRLRRLCQPAFSSRRRVADYASPVARSADFGTASWSDGQVLDVYHELQHIFAYSHISIMFGTVIDSTTRDKLCRDLLIVINGFFRRMVSPATFDWLPVPADIRFRRALHDMRSTLYNIATLGSQEALGDGVVATLVRDTEPAVHDGLPHLSSRELVDHLVTFFAAGIDSTSSTLAWALYELSRDPEAASNLRQELDQVLQGARPDASHLPQLVYTEAVVTETLRLHSPIWMLTRTTSCETNLDGYRIPKGSDIAVSPYTFQHRADFYSDPLYFSPERWLSKRPDRATFIPFGAGPRKCIAEPIAQSQIVIALASIASQWHFEPITDRPSQPRARVNVRPKSLRLRAHKH